MNGKWTVENGKLFKTIFHFQFTIIEFNQFSLLMILVKEYQTHRRQFIHYYSASYLSILNQNQSVLTVSIFLYAEHQHDKSYRPFVI